MNIDEATRAYVASTELLDLCDAYRCTSQANAIVFTRMASKIEQVEESTPEEVENLRVDIERRIQTSREHYLTWLNNADELSGRIFELSEFKP